jgi:hypothetical protein
MADQEQMTKEQQETWRKTLTEGHPNITFFHWLFRYLPGPPDARSAIIRSAESAARSSG